MFKKINLVIVAFFSVLTVMLDIGFVLYIPLLLFYLLRDVKNIYYMIIPGILALYLFTGLTYMIPFLIMLIVVLFILWIMSKLAKGYYIYGFVLLLNILMQYLVFKGISNWWRFLLLTAISLLLYLYFERNLIESLKSKSTFFNSAYLENIIFLIAVIGGASAYVYNINLGFLVSVFYAMYMAKSNRNIYAMLYGIMCMLILIFYFEVSEAIFIPLIVALYLLPSVYPLLALNVFSVAVFFAKTTYSDYYIVGMMITSIVFEIFKMYIAKEYKKDEEVKELIYTQVATNLSEEVLRFTQFLDRFASSFQVPKEYNEKLSEGIKTIVQNHCAKCEKRKECFDKNKGNMYIYFRNLLQQSDNQKEDYYDFFRSCLHIKEIENTTKRLSSRIDYTVSPSNNNALIAQITGVSNAIRKYAVDLVSKNEISYEILKEAKTRIINYGYDICYFEIERAFDEDFIIRIGIKDVNFVDAKKAIKIICDSVFPHPVTVSLEKKDKHKIYVKVIPELKLDIIYGYGSMSSDGSNICGDNYIIKELNNGKFISAISDGMGKGYSAFCESDMTLKLVQDVISLNLDSTSALEILNTFYVIQDYLERYATLDLLEINRYNLTARFYKMGGTTSYIVRQNGNIEKIINKSLPFGIDETINNYDYKLENGDLILMSSDGIFENIIEKTSIEEFIASIKDDSPQKIIYQLLNYTSHQNLKTNDDMTVIALKVKTTG